MDIKPVKIIDTIVLELFSEHDDYMIAFLDDDKWCYTRKRKYRGADFDKKRI